ncbi:GNAT family N-acetyltransferase [Bacillus sp. AK128]
MKTTVMNRELADSIENAEIEMFESRLTAIQSLTGNPMGVEIKKFGHATCFSVQQIPGPSYNTVKGLRAGDEPFVEEILSFYNEKNIPVRFELTPGHTSPELLMYLSKQGYYQNDFHTALYQSLDNTNLEPNDHNLSIRELAGDEFQVFAELYVKGFGMPPFLVEDVAQNNQVLHGNPDWTFYLASLGEVHVGVAVVFIKNRIATLAAAATLPEYTKKGIQSSLIKARMNQAIHNKCVYILGQAQFGSTSHRNMERAGMKIAYTKAIWVKN